MPKKNLTDRTLKALKPAKPGVRYEIMDTEVPAFGVRVTDKGQRSFILIARYPGSKHPARRTLGEYPELSLQAARDKARAWREMIRRGIDPREKDEERRRAERERRTNTFGAVAEDFIKRHLKDQRRAVRSEREIRKELIARWIDKPVTDITRREVVDMVNEILERGAKRQAHNILGLARVIFNWAVNQEVYGLEHSPCERVKPKALIGEKAIRQRVLDDPEVRSIWQASEGLDYPYGPLVRLLMLTGGRLMEVAEAHWREFDLAGKLWTIPQERFKSGSSHLVPLSPDAITILNSLPRFASGDFLFSANYGRKAVNGFSKAKQQLDKLTGEIEAWTFHDIRRTVRTRLSALRVPEPVAELVIGHARKGLARVYDQHKYLDEMREALEAWAGKLRDIVEPPPANVVKLQPAVA